MATVLLAAVGVGVSVWAMRPTTAVPAASVWTSGPSPTSPSTPEASGRTPDASPTSPAPATTGRPATPSSTMPGNCSGTHAETPGWRATLPAGWSCDYQPGAELVIIDAQANVIGVEATVGPPTTACVTRLAAQGTVTRLADTRWGGKVAITSSVTARSWTMLFRCTTSNTYTYMMTALVVGGPLDSVVAAQEALAQSWAWKA